MISRVNQGEDLKALAIMGKMQADVVEGVQGLARMRHHTLQLPDLMESYGLSADENLDTRTLARLDGITKDAIKNLLLRKGVDYIDPNDLQSMPTQVWDDIKAELDRMNVRAQTRDGQKAGTVSPGGNL